MRKKITIGLLLLTIAGCAVSKKKLQKNTASVLESELFEHQFTGFFLMDAETRDTLYRLNSTKYFTPASNTKIFTLFTSLQLLPDHIPALKYGRTNDTLFVEGTGDPTLLHPHFRDSTALHFLKSQDSPISLYLNNFQEKRFGPGWAWGDYPWYYSAERSALPMYGNVVSLYQMDGLQVSPVIFQDKVVPSDQAMPREEYENRFYFDPARKDTVEIPIKWDTLWTRRLWEDVLNRPITLASEPFKGKKSTLYSIPSDSVYTKMMQDSDNFLAEQLLVLAASTRSDTLDTQEVRDFVLDSLLGDLKQTPRWVDGSGLSRYNLFTPESMAHVLYRMYQEIPRKRLFHFFPAGGVSGTLKHWYPGNAQPYIYGKTGSLGNNHCLSGYLLTQSGKTLIFSFMNNHFRRPTAEVKENMQRIFESIRNHY